MATPTQPQPQPQPHTPPTHVCIVGGGIIGTATAYFLATVYGIRTTIIDRTGTIAPAASGKAGGFLAFDWNDGTATESLTHRSFHLHEVLAQQFTPESIQYRRLSCVAMNIGASRPATTTTSRKLQHIEWASSDVIQNIRTLGTEATIAQVHPKLLCERLWSETQQCVPSCELLRGTVVATLFATNDDQNDDQNEDNDDSSRTTMNAVRGVQLEDGTVVEADAVLYACGPWNVLHRPTTGDLNTVMRGIKYHSLVVPTERVYHQCVFFHGHNGDPEVYVRPDQTAYCTGYPEPPRIVTEMPGDEAIEDHKITTIYTAMQQVTRPATTTRTQSMTDTDALPTTRTQSMTDTDALPEEENDKRPGLKLDDPNAFRQQACYLPITDDGLPIMGELSRHGRRGLYIATGHSCWGILLGPGTGECMASLMATGESTPYVALHEFDPYRFVH